MPVIRRELWLTGAIACLGAAAWTVAVAAEPAAGWHNDYEQARNEARLHNKPIFLVFR